MIPKGIKLKFGEQPYDNNYYCSRCGMWIPKFMAKRDVKGAPICPYCTSRVRTHSHRYGNKVTKLKRVDRTQ
jgi:DNA-directed RNA polymerase subunit RPC12/RpoP